MQQESESISKNKTELNKAINILIISCLIWLPVALKSQQKDFQIWTSAAVSKEYNKKFTLGAELQSRFENNVSQLNNYFTELSGKYEITKWYRPGINYRLSRWGDGLGAEQRVDLDNTFRIKMDNNRIDFRARAQREFDRGELSEDNLRFKFQFQHKFSKKLKSYAAAEYWYTWEYAEGFRNWSRQRYTGGLEFEFTKNNSFCINFIFSEFTIY